MQFSLNGYRELLSGDSDDRQTRTVSHVRRYRWTSTCVLRDWILMNDCSGLDIEAMVSFIVIHCLFLFLLKRMPIVHCLVSVHCHLSLVIEHSLFPRYFLYMLFVSWQVRKPVLTRQCYRRTSWS